MRTGAGGLPVTVGRNTRQIERNLPGKCEFPPSGNGDVMRYSVVGQARIFTGLCSISGVSGENCRSQITVEKQAFSTLCTWLCTTLFHKPPTCGKNVNMHDRVYIITVGINRQIVQFRGIFPEYKVTAAFLWKLTLDSNLISVPCGLRFRGQEGEEGRRSRNISGIF